MKQLQKSLLFDVEVYRIFLGLIDDLSVLFELINTHHFQPCLETVSNLI